MTPHSFSTVLQPDIDGSEKAAGDRTAGPGQRLACRRPQAGGWLSALLLFGMMSVPVSGWAQFIQMDLAVDVKSRFSDGCSSVHELQTLAQHRGLGGLIFGDHDRKSLEYGIWPFERILKKKDEHPSLLYSGAATALAEIRRPAVQAGDRANSSCPENYNTGSEENNFCLNGIRMLPLKTVCAGRPRAPVFKHQDFAIGHDSSDPVR